MKFLVYGNPKGKGKKKGMPAALKAYWAKHRGGASSSSSKKKKKKKASGHGKHTSVKISARRNPIVPRGFADSHLKPAVIGAGGALLNDVAMGFVFSKLPANFQRPEYRQPIKALVAVGAGMALEQVTSKGIARQATVGALTCIAHDLARSMAQKVLPAGLTLDGLGAILDRGMVMVDDYMPQYQLNGPGGYDTDAIRDLFPMNTSAG